MTQVISEIYKDFSISRVSPERWYAIISLRNSHLRTLPPLALLRISMEVPTAGNWNDSNANCALETVPLS